MQEVTVPDQDILDAAVSQVFPDGILGMHTASLGIASVDSSRPATPQPLKTAPQTATASSSLVEVSVQLQQLIEVLKQNPPTTAQITNTPTSEEVFNQMADPPTDLEKQELCRTPSSSSNASSAAALERNRLMEGLKVAC